MADEIKIEIPSEDSLPQLQSVVRHTHNGVDSPKLDFFTAEKEFTETITSSTVQNNAAALRQTTNTTYTKVKEIRYNDVPGTITVKFSLAEDGAGTADGQVYINNVPVGIERSYGGSTFVVYSEDFEVQPRDLIQLYYKHSTGSANAAVEAFQLCYDKILTLKDNDILTN